MVNLEQQVGHSHRPVKQRSDVFSVEVLVTFDLCVEVCHNVKSDDLAQFQLRK